jgi:hypothetical protein
LFTLISFRETLLNGQPLNLEAEGTLPVLSPETYHTGQSLTVTLPPASVGFWVLPGIKVKPCLTVPVDSRLETSDMATNYQVRSMMSRSLPHNPHSDQEIGNNMSTESREHGITDYMRQFPNEMKSKIHSKKHVIKYKNDEFSNTNMEEIKPVTEEGGFERDNMATMEEFGMIVNSESLRQKRNDMEKGARGRYRRYAPETGTYIIPGMEPDYFQSNNGMSIKNSLWRKKRGDILQKLARISKHEGNIRASLYEPHHHVHFEDVNEGFPVINSNEHAVRTFQRGDIYMRQGGESYEERNKDYDYVDKDENVYEEEENVSFQPEHFHGPTEYFEIFQTSRPVADKKFAGYDGELSEAELLVMEKPSEQEEKKGSSDEDNDDMIIQEQGPTGEEDHRAKVATTKMLNTYYTDIYEQDASDEGEDFEEESGIREKYKTDIRDKISNRRRAEESNRKYNDKVITKITYHIDNNPDSSILKMKTGKDAISENDIHNNEYDSDAYVPAEEGEIARSSHNIKESFYHDNNIPDIDKEYYYERSRSSRKRRQGKENSMKINQRKDLQSTEDDNQHSYYEKSNHEPSKIRKISSASQGYTRQPKETARKIIHKVIYNNNNEDDDDSSDARKNHSKQKSRNSITQKSSQRRANDSNEDDDSESESSERFQQYNAKSKGHNQKVHRKNDNSERDEYSHEQRDSTDVREDDNKQKVMQTLSRNRKYERAAYQQNTSSGKNVDEVSESAATLKGHNPTQSIIPSYRQKSSRKALNNTYRTNTESGRKATQRLASSEELSEQESHTKYKEKKKYSSHTEVTRESEEMPETNEEQEEATGKKIMANKSRQRNSVTMRAYTTDKELRRRVRRDVPSQLPMMETSVENRHKWTNARKETSQNKYTESVVPPYPTNAKLEMKPQNVKDKNKLQTTYRALRESKTVKPHRHSEWYTRIKSSEDSKQMNEDHSTVNDKSIKKHDGSSDEYGTYKGSTEEMDTNPQHKISNSLLDEYDEKVYEKEDTNPKYWKFHRDGSLEYFMDPEQQQNKGNTKREIGTSVIYEPSNDITISSSMETEANENTAKHQHERGLITGYKMVNPLKEGERGDSPMDVSVGETMLPATSEAGLMEKRSESVLGKKQQTGMMSHKERIINVDRVKNIHKDQNDALNMKVYQEEFEGLDTSVIRLPKGIATHMHPLHHPGKETIGENEYKQDLMSNTEKYKNIKNKIMTDEETRYMDIPEKTDQELHKDENGRLHFGAGQYKSDKIKTSSEEDEQEVVSHMAEQITEDTVPILSFGDDMASKQNPSLESAVKLHMSNSDSNDVKATEVSKSQVGSAAKKLSVIDDIKSNIHSIIDKTGTTVLKASNDIKENKNGDETVGYLKDVHSKVMKKEDKIFKMTQDMMSSRSAQQPSMGQDPDNDDMAQMVNTVSAEFKTKNGPEEAHPSHLAHEGLKNIQYFDNLITSSTGKGSDGTHDKFEDFVTNNIAYDGNVADSLVRNAKDLGHLNHIVAKNEILNNNPNDHLKLQLSTLINRDHIKAELEKKRLERLHVLTEQRAKFKEELLKIRARAAEGKLKLGHHVKRRDTTQDEEHIQPLMSKSVARISYEPISIQNEKGKNYTKKDNPSTESQNLREIYIDSSSYTATDSSSNTDIDSSSNTDTDSSSYTDNDSSSYTDTDSSSYTDIDSSSYKDTDSSSYTEQSSDKYFSQGRHRQLKPASLPVSMMTNMKDIQVPACGCRQIHKTPHYSEPKNLPMKYISDSKDIQVPACGCQQIHKAPHYSEPKNLPMKYISDSKSVKPVKSLFRGGHAKDMDPDKENVSQIYNINFSPDQGVAEDASVEDQYAEIKQLSSPQFIRRLGIKNDPVIVQFQNIPTSENDIRFYLDSERDEAEDLIRKQRYTSTRSKRALIYPLNDKFNDDLLNSHTMSSKDNPRTEDNTNAKYWLQNVFKNTSTTQAKEGENKVLNHNMHGNVMMPMNNKLIISHMSSESSMLPSMEEFQYYSDSIPTNSLHVTNIKLIKDNKSKDMKYISHENSEENQTYLETLGNHLNDILNEEDDDNKIKDGLSETSNEVNIKTNEINRQFKISDAFMKSKHDNSINKDENEEHTSEMKEIPFKLHKHVLNSNYEPTNSKIRKYLYPNKYKPSVANSEKFPSNGYSSTVKTLPNRSSPEETSDTRKEIFSVTLDEFPNINSKSTEISETTISHHGTMNIPKEIPKIASEYKDISDIPFSSTIMTNRDTDYFTEPDVKKHGKEGFLISQIYPQENQNYLFRSMKNVAALEQKAVDTETIPNSEKDTEHSHVVDRNTEPAKKPGGHEDSDNIKNKKTPASTTGYIHSFLKNISDNVIKFIHKISPWNY